MTCSGRGKYMAAEALRGQARNSGGISKKPLSRNAAELQSESAKYDDRVLR